MDKDLSKLIGYQILSLNDAEIKVRDPYSGGTYDIVIDDYGGDCCGFNSIETELFYEEGSERNPVITAVGQDTEGSGDGQKCKVTFFGEDKTIATINTFSYSGSGWCYGATVSVKCDFLDIYDILSSW